MKQREITIITSSLKLWIQWMKVSLNIIKTFVAQSFISTSMIILIFCISNKNNRSQWSFYMCFEFRYSMHHISNLEYNICNQVMENSESTLYYSWVFSPSSSVHSLHNYFVDNQKIDKFGYYDCCKHTWWVRFTSTILLLVTKQNVYFQKLSWQF